MTDEPQIPRRNYAWLLWGRRVGKPEGENSPLGCYASRDVALEAERMAKEHANAPLWDEFWITPWPLATKPMVNFRMERR
jgi:hypothetical protein